jgi:hypothetical protein
MDLFQTRLCTREQAGVMTRNPWRVLLQNGRWLCIREPNVEVSVFPGVEERCYATIEMLENRPENYQDADDDCRAVVADLFSDIGSQDENP